MALPNTERDHYPAQTEASKITQEFRDFLVDQNIEMLNIYRLLIDLALEKTKNQKVLRQIHETDPDEYSLDA